MSRKIGIIGMGNVGAAVAHGAIAQGLADSYVFIDINEKKAEADAQDFKDAMANLPHYASIVVNDYAALEDADVIISSLGNIQLQHNAGEDRFAEFPFTREAVYQVSQELKKIGFSRNTLGYLESCRCCISPLSGIHRLAKRTCDWDRDFTRYV